MRSADSPFRAPAPGTRRPVHGDSVWLRTVRLAVERDLHAAFQSPERIPVRAPELKTRRLPVDRPQLMVNVFAALVPPPGVGLTTVTLAVPAVLMSAAGTVAVKVVLLTYFVVSFVPFHSIIEPEI